MPPPALALAPALASASALAPELAFGPEPAPVPEAGAGAYPGSIEPVVEPELAPRVAKALLTRSPETLHPMLWLGHQLGRHGGHTLASGFPALDAQLPEGGWPRRVLTELLLRHPGVGEIRLLAPPLVATQQAGRLVMLFDPPAGLSSAAFTQLGFDVEQLLVVNTRAHVIPGSDSLWALEQALKSGHVGAVVAWLPPRLRADRVRRLQLAAHAHDGPAFALREMAVAGRPSASPLRLALRPAGADAIEIEVVKRRGPPLETPLKLALPAVLSNAARQRARAGLSVAPVMKAATFVDLA